MQLNLLKQTIIVILKNIKLRQRFCQNLFKPLSDHKPPKEKSIKAIETIEEIAKKSTNDENLKTEIEKTAAICKFWIKIS